MTRIEHQASTQSPPYTTLPRKPPRNPLLLNLPLRSTCLGQRTRTINHIPIRHTHHAHLDHSHNKRVIPRLLIHPKPRKSQRRRRIPRNVPISGESKRRVSPQSLCVVLDVPDTWGGVESGAGLGGIEELLFGG